MIIHALRLTRRPDAGRRVGVVKGEGVSVVLGRSRMVARVRRVAWCEDSVSVYVELPIVDVSLPKFDESC